MSSRQLPEELKRAQSRIEESARDVEQLKLLAKREPGQVIAQAQRLLTGELITARNEIRTAYYKGFQTEAQHCESYLYKRQADVALAILCSLPLAKNDGFLWGSRAEEWLRKSLELYPSLQTRFNLAVLYAALERYDDALTEATVVVRSNDPAVRIAAERFIRELSSSPMQSIAAHRFIQESQKLVGNPDTKGLDMSPFKCRECGVAIPLKQHGALAGMEIEGPCPKCGSPMPFRCPSCNNPMTTGLVCDHGKWKCVKCFKGGGCYIATACYGSYDHPDVLIFRRYRDERLLPSSLGRLLVMLYYKASPVIAERLGHVYWLARLIRHSILEPLAKRLQ